MLKHPSVLTNESAVYLKVRQLARCEVRTDSCPCCLYTSGKWDVWRPNWPTFSHQYSFVTSSERFLCSKMTIFTLQVLNKLKKVRENGRASVRQAPVNCAALA